MLCSKPSRVSTLLQTLSPLISLLTLAITLFQAHYPPGGSWDIPGAFLSPFPCSSGSSPCSPLRPPIFLAHFLTSKSSLQPFLS